MAHLVETVRRLQREQALMERQLVELVALRDMQEHQLAVTAELGERQ